MRESVISTPLHELAVMAAVSLRLAVLLAMIASTSSLHNGLGLTPPMGFNSWNHFRCHISDNLIRQTADAFVSTGLAKAGRVPA